MAKHLSRRDIDYILYSITEWNMKGDKLTWDNLCKKYQERSGKPQQGNPYIHTKKS